MATMPTYAHLAAPKAQPGPRAERDPFQLRALPQEDVIFFCKRIDNSRLVREADPRSRNASWSAIGVASIALALLTGGLFPNLANTLAGYKLQDLRGEQGRLVDERRTLELQEAELLSPERLAKLAAERHLDTPKAGQVFRLDNDKPGSTVAMVK